MIFNYWLIYYDFHIIGSSSRFDYQFLRLIQKFSNFLNVIFVV